ncbi:hypothetical protein E3N88_04179 [Mikania micrantha]|uniref:Reverse transcriptase domain-containing protein n=1 Tax=Mikania micrantha TaxID=192012 RepID=A0A5N6PVU2_9ASTR|nr:hypothetical protein E3N88_04179 [Mikania micrantha]
MLKPPKYACNEGTTSLFHTPNSIEDIHDFIGCAENPMVKIASSAFHKGALTWWNSKKNARGREVSLALPSLGEQTMGFRCAWGALFKTYFVQNNDLQRSGSPVVNLNRTEERIPSTLQAIDITTSMGDNGLSREP